MNSSDSVLYKSGGIDLDFEKDEEKNSTDFSNLRFVLCKLNFETFDKKIVSLVGTVYELTTKRTTIKLVLKVDAYESVAFLNNWQHVTVKNIVFSLGDLVNIENTTSRQIKSCKLKDIDHEKGTAFLSLKIFTTREENENEKVERSIL